MSAKRLGHFAAGLFVALGLAFGGALLATADGSGSAAVVNSAPVTVEALNVDVDWH